MPSLILGLLILAAATPREQFEALKAEYEARTADWDRQYLGGDKPIEESQVDHVGRLRDWPAWSYAPRFLAFAEAHPGDPAGVAALFWVADLIGAVGDRDRALVPIIARSLDRIAASHVDDPRVDALCRTIAFSGAMPSSEGFLRSASEKAKDRAVRGRAGLGLARLLEGRREQALSPWFDRPSRSKHQELAIELTDPAYFAGIRAVDPKSLMVEVDREFARVAKEYGDVVADSRPGRDRTIAEVVETELFEVRHLGLGQVAPEIEGRDSDDTPFKLSDYRGKVVVLTFSGNWCGPCVGMYPGERDLARRLKDRPFAILSVNTDEDKETLRRSIKAGEVTWRCWWDGAIDGPICTAWNVRSFPTVYVLDAKGVIREKQLRGEQLDAAVEKLVAETAAARP